MVVAIFTTTLLILRLTTSVIRPLMALTVSANSVAKGDFGVSTLPVNSTDEIGIVTKAYNNPVAGKREAKRHHRSAR
ncbi:MAG: HAMP domain-containing protein [Prevotella sp.]|nr:HAMP domain-containing protein [Prevotella sp.]